MKTAHLLSGVIPILCQDAFVWSDAKSQADLSVGAVAEVTANQQDSPIHT